MAPTALGTSGTTQRTGRSQCGPCPSWRWSRVGASPPRSVPRCGTGAPPAGPPRGAGTAAPARSPRAGSEGRPRRRPKRGLGGHGLGKLREFLSWFVYRSYSHALNPGLRARPPPWVTNLEKKIPGGRPLDAGVWSGACRRRREQRRRPCPKLLEVGGRHSVENIKKNSFRASTLNMTQQKRQGGP